MISRRKVVAGVAWSAPVLVVAGAAPAAAASPNHEIIVAPATKCPGESDVPGGWPKQGYLVPVTVSPAGAALVVGEVRTSNGKAATVVHVEEISPGRWEIVVDADSSPSALSLILAVSGGGGATTYTTPAYPHCP